MGTWGTGLYADDTTCDIRDDFIKGLKQGLSSEKSCQAILDRYGKLLEQPETACLVYFALADTAWKYGRLPEQLRTKALALLETGESMLAWEREAPGSAPARRKVLKNLSVRLNSPQPPEKHLRISLPKSRKVRTSAPIGSVFSLALPSGKLALLVLVGYRELSDSIDPVFSVPSWREVSLAVAPPQLTVEEPTVAFRSFHKEFLHVAILPADKHRNILSSLAPTDIKAKAPMPYRPDSIVWLSIGRIAREIDAHFDACQTP